WVELGASWVPATWPDQSVKHRFDVGVNVLIRLGARPWKRLLRTNTRNPHPLFFGVYGNPPLIYHHGAGFRPPFSSRDGRETTSATRAERLAHNETLSRELHQAATVDPDFWRCLCE